MNTNTNQPANRIASCSSTCACVDMTPVSLLILHPGRLNSQANFVRLGPLFTIRTNRLKRKSGTLRWLIEENLRAQRISCLYSLPLALTFIPTERTELASPPRHFCLNLTGA